MQLHLLPKLTEKSSKRVGRGHGSGRGKTSGRGTKGQKARGTIPLHFEGGALPLIKRLPFRRGKGKNKVFNKKPLVINIKHLNILPKNSIIDIENLVKYKIVNFDDAKSFGIKILGEGTLSIPLILKLSASAGAKQKIEKAGGKVEVS